MLLATLALLLAQTPDAGEAALPPPNDSGAATAAAGAAAPTLAEPPDAGVLSPHLIAPAPPGPKGGDGRVSLSVGAEAAFELFPSGPPGGAQDLFFDLTPMISFEAGEDFGAQVGAPLRLRVFDDPPENRSNDYGGVLRREDWDETSDFGQLIRLLRIGRLDSQIWVRAGPATTKTMGLGHLINRYSNRDNPNYHPASGNAGVALGPVRAEFFASDILGGRLFAGELGVEFGRIFAKDPKWYDRFHLVFSVAHDAGRASGGTTPVSILNLDFDAVLYRTQAARVMALAGFGSRVAGRADVGATLGLAADADLDGFLMGGKLEARKQAGGYRQGFFGPGYELSRFVGTGFSGPPIALEVLPDAFSFYAEVRMGVRGVAIVDAMVEHFTWGRTDIDSTFSLTVWEQRVVGAARFTAIGLGQLPRFSTGGRVSVRILPALYLLTEGGIVFTPQPDGTLSRGWYASLGVGADFEKTF